RENHELGGLRSFFLEALMVGFYNMSAVLLGEPRPRGELWFDWPEPDYYARFRDRLPVVRFSMPSVQVRLLASYLDRRLIMPDPGSPSTCSRIRTSTYSRCRSRSATETRPASRARSGAGAAARRARRAPSTRPVFAEARRRYAGAAPQPALFEEPRPARAARG